MKGFMMNEHAFTYDLDDGYGLGATPLEGGGRRFLTWAPAASAVDLHVTHPNDYLTPMADIGDGYYTAVLPEAGAEVRYLYRLYNSSNREASKYVDRPDPASKLQPEGVHGPSQAVSGEFEWDDECWNGIPLSRYVIYEIHAGTFTIEGGFDGVAEHLDHLRSIGITAIELMPVAQFPGTRNWGYDGVYPFAVQNSYGGPEGLKRLVNACHCRGMAVVLDVVYNHPGPEGNYLSDFGPYFTDFYRTPWGEAVNFDGPESHHVRRFYIENAHRWFAEFHIDALRIDAVHAMPDFSARPFLQELMEHVQRWSERLNRRIYCIAESALNDVRILRSRELGGFQMDAQWNDDFHHALHTLLTGERNGYYEDFGSIEDMAKAIEEGFVNDGRYSTFHRRPHGNSSREISGGRFVVFAQNHDQIGNRMLGERLSVLVSFEQLKLAAGVVFLSPFIPLVFMGDEYGETAPFQYFISHTDPDLAEAVRNGRRREFAAFGWEQLPPDPMDEEVFKRCRLDRSLMDKAPGRALIRFYRELIGLRNEIPALSDLTGKRTDVKVVNTEKEMIFMRRKRKSADTFIVFQFSEEPEQVSIPAPAGNWKKRLDSADLKWLGPGTAVPDMLSSAGKVDITTPGRCVILFSR